jgi:aspartate/methionine/tyrosine aminotransferase
MVKSTSHSQDDETIAALIDRSEQRKKILRKVPETSKVLFKGANGRKYEGIIDAYHGEISLPLESSAKHALQRAWDQILNKTLPADYSNDELYDKRQPLILRQLAADKIFAQLSLPTASIPGINVKPDNVIVCPYSSMVLIDEAVTTIARPDGIIVCPEGFYKNFGLVARKLGLRIVTCPNVADDSFKIDAASLAECLRSTMDTGKLCGVLLTLPGNPVVSEYSLDELVEIGTVLAEADVPVICDMAFSRLVEGFVPLAALRVNTSRGEVYLYDKILTVTGNSKAYNAFGPCKFGAGCTGNVAWMDQINQRLTVSFQRETTHLVRAIIEHTSEEYIENNKLLMFQQFRRTLEIVRCINNRLGSEVLRPLGSPQGIFLGLTFDPTILSTRGILTSSELEYALLNDAGIDSVALDRTGSPRIGVRLNIFAPRKKVGQEQTELVVELFDRLEGFMVNMIHSNTSTL